MTLPKWEDHGQKILDAIPEAKAVAVDFRGHAHWYSGVPKKDEKCWSCFCSGYLGRFSCDDWTKSLIVKRWKPAVNENFFIVNNYGEVGRYFFQGDKYDQKTIKYGNCFKTREEAEAMAEKVRKVFKGEQ